MTVHLAIRKIPIFTLIVTVVCLVLGACSTAKGPHKNVSNVVTADIQVDIEQHIEEQAKLNEGYFKIPFEDQELHLKLVRVHTEYLANLTTQEHFVCVDLVSTYGDVYDVDFFFFGDRGRVTVTKTIVHKTNGQPQYVWKQKEDKTWHRLPVDNATPDLLGIVKERDRFEFFYQVILPEITDKGRMWIPLPVTDQYQTIEVQYIDAPVDHQILEDRKYRNKMFFMVLNHENSGDTVEICYRVERREKGVYRDNTGDSQYYLKPNRLVPENKNFSEIAEKVVAGKPGNLARVRALYDHTIDRMRYMKYGDGWGKGDALYACDMRTGNCTDFHSYFIALSRAVGIPARFAIGASIPSERNKGGIGGYHCWAEFYTNGKWWPTDISEGDKYPALSTYYFSHHPANRIEFSRGRDLVVEPGPASGPINFLAYPLLEISGEIVKTEVKFSFNRLSFPPS